MTGESGPGGVPEALVETHRRISLVWVVPLVALVTGAYVAYRAIVERGPEITVRFKSAGGLEAGKTQVRFKDVEVGVVEEIELAEDLSGVICHVRMAKGMQKHLNDETQFWVVKARITGGQVSGLGTLLGGAYVGMYPGRSDKRKRAFEGLDAPPIVMADMPGRHFVLHSYRAGHVTVGTPVFYRKIEVGRVVASELAPSGDFVEIKVFVDAPYDARVRQGSHFWNASGIDVSMGATGLQIHTESLVGIVIGGIAFDTPSGSAGEPAEPETVFTLYESYDATRKPVYTRQVSYLLHFEQSVRGLNVGSPVEFHGIVIGDVTDVKLEYDPATNRLRIPVVIEIQPERIRHLSFEGEAARHAVIEKLVDAGLRAQLKSGSLLTGQLVVSLDMHQDAAPAKIVWSDPYPELPTVPAPLEEIETSLAHIAQRIEKIPFERIGADLSGALRQVNQQLVPRLDATLAQAGGTLASVGPDSQVNAELLRTLADLSDAARALELTADELERQPQSLIFGKGGHD
jgi:paraquat-inducible protein B